MRRDKLADLDPSLGFPITFDNPREVGEVWYCQRCRRAVRSRPVGFVEPSCRCATPVVRLDSTVVSCPRRDSRAGAVKAEASKTESVVSPQEPE